MKKLRISLIFSKLVVNKPLITIIALMHNFIIKFGKILDIFKEFAGNRVNEFGNVPRRGVVPKFSDLEVLALSATAEVLRKAAKGTLHPHRGQSVGSYNPAICQFRQSSENWSSEIRINLIHPTG